MPAMPRSDAPKRRIRTVSLGILRGMVRVELELGYTSLRVYVDEHGLALSVLVDDGAPQRSVALYAVDTRDGDELPDFCGRHLGSAGEALHLFEVDPRSAESMPTDPPKPVACR